MTADHLTVGSLCTGYGGLDLALKAHFQTRVIWTSEIDKHASRVVKARYRAPNLGDLKLIDWEAIEAPDIITAGYPCQPFSYAGGRNGTEDPRHIWPWIAEGIRHLRPRLAVMENVPGHLTKGFGEVIGTLAEMGYDATWGCVRASDAGACHRRERVFIVATDTTNQRREWEWVARGRGDGPTDRGDAARCPECGAGWNSLTHQRHAYGWRTNAEVLADREASIDADGAGRQGRGRPVESPRELAAAAGHLPADAGVKLLPTPTVNDSRGGRNITANRSAKKDTTSLGWTLTDVAYADRWGEYAPAIARWEHVLGRPAPAPVDGKGRLSPVFVEWMMGLRAGHVTAIDLARSQQLKILGNGVVWQQAALALTHLLPIALTPSRQRTPA
jgi:DNA (cytosine-5)-methyltransferase 1